MLDKTIHNNALFDAYGSFLTEKQQDIYICTYKEDLSLAEVAENLGISRAAVHDALKKAQATLEAMEEKLHLVKKDEERRILYAKLEEIGNAEVREIVKKLRNIDEF